MTPLELLLALIVAHFLCDYPLQGPFISQAKSRVTPVPGFPWWQAMTAHALIHGGAVWLITGLWWLGALEAFAHFVIDDEKCRGRLSVNADQAAHLYLKVCWAIAALNVSGWSQ